MLGICIILVPVLFVYLAVITTLEKTISHFKSKVIICVSIILLAESFVYLVSADNYLEGNYFYALGNLFSNGFNAANRFTAGGGLLSGVFGYPILVGFGKPAAICVIVVLMITLILIVCKISLNDIGRAARRVGQSVGQAYEKSGMRLRSRKWADDEYEQFDEFEDYDVFEDTPTQRALNEFNIDIPIDDVKTKKRRRRKSNIDISIDDDSVSAGSEADAFIDAIKSTDSSDPDSFEPTVSNYEPEKRTRKDDEIPAPEFDEPKETHYDYPPIGLLRLVENEGENGEAEMRANAQRLMTTLESFGVRATITHISRGPSVTRYELYPEPGVKISKITNLSDDIALNLAANGVRIEAPIPGKAAVGIEVPNKVVSMVSIRELIDSDEFEDSESKLTCVLGRDISGKIITTDIAKLPHLLIAGTTGSGKSVCVNALLISILFKANPDEVKLVLIDPKMVEFSKYKGIPHLLIPVVSDAKKAAGALAWAVNEMQNRYKLFSEYDCKDIESYNKLIESNLEYIKQNPPVLDEESEDGEYVQPVLEVNGLPVAKEKLPRIVIAIDELADLMMTAPSEVEDSIVRLAQLARAAGMHLVIATQRPTANVITGLIKANVPSRIALKVGSNMDSRIILDTGGAEKLIGRGDMLYMPVGAPNPIRVQGCFATEDEIGKVTKFVKKSATAQYNEDIEEKIKRIAAEGLNGDDGDSESSMGGIEVDSKMEEAIKIVIEAGQASTSMLQRRMKVGYARAGRMIDDMEQLGIVGPHQGSKPRDVIMTYSEWLERSNNLHNE
ncbi:MAG: DNA translocase FtsK [Ruminococcus sp.]|nr:DNA translocase FtsK [Ruminococcus sp.]